MHSRRLSRPLWAVATLLLCVAVVRAQETCYWRSQDSVTVQTGGWFACNNTNTTPGGAQLCCLNGANCGEDSICSTSDSGGGSGWFVGGCTDPTYQDPVCRRSCTGDAQTWIQYNFTSELWHCCGSSGCTGTPTSETFQAVPPNEWSAVPSSPTANPSASGGATANSTVTVTASPSSSSGSSGGLSTGATAAIGVLAALLGLALIAAAVFFVLWRKRRQQHSNVAYDTGRQQEHATQPPMQYEPQQEQSPLYQPLSHQAELAAARQNSERTELDGYPVKSSRQEML